MNPSSLLQAFILIPLFGLFCTFWIPKKKEKAISVIVLSTVGLHFCLFLAFVTSWLLNGHEVLDIRHATLFKADTIEIFIDFYFDKITAVYALVGSILISLVAVFSRYYLHREEGFKRFFSILLLFYTGYNIVVFSGNFETFFVGWEILGLTSFLLIAFYRDRYLPVKNAFKVLSVYRLSDACLMLAMWMSHHLWHENITFIKLQDLESMSAYLQQHGDLVLFISLMLFLAAAVKSALVPFSSWLPRAMEGPTTSSAIFYGSLSVHLGVFLLLRTSPIWQSLPFMKVLIILAGLSTSLIAALIARVQSSVKSQIAYSSISQIGLIFIEVAAGFHDLALLHFAGNAFLRTYQLLVSPSVMSYLIHDQFYNFNPDSRAINDSSAFKKIRATLYVLSTKEWNLDFILYRFGWRPFKWLGSSLALLVLIATLCVFFFFTTPPFSIAIPFAFLSLILVLNAFNERGSAQKAWAFVFLSQCSLSCSIFLHKTFDLSQLLIYLGGSLASFMLGLVCLHKIKSIDGDIELNGFHGYVQEQAGVSLLFLLACLGVLGFPITPTFIGIDLMFSHINQDQPVLIALTALSFIFIELAALRIYVRIFLGQHKKNNHPIAYRSS